MAGQLNKKVLCFVDEYGTAGAGDLYLGATIMLAREAGRIDKCFSDRLESSANEVHAVQMDDGYLQGLLDRFWQGVPKNSILMLNRKCGAVGGSAPTLYASALVETVKIGLKRFRSEVLKQDTIGNVDLILDINHHNSHADFDAAIEKARAESGSFRGVNSVAKIDSAASRMLQLADVVAYSRK
ncbi:DUF3800 domain-containing protein [Methylobacterium sp. E-041]|uniref:DUF3800 domain-containing protein n=1 Tax=Methylobacterium sp. E-041 TaxID=2836573 RepID=UPI001FB94F6D|nr:DUF3800 domain-containing protein [Methylobacterium sp. E-041]MCJ2106997.1 DUF3800 domain-containing protein [Methylobacterium sp. E-041]